MKIWLVTVAALGLLTGCDREKQNTVASTDNSKVVQNSFGKTAIDAILDGYKHNENFMGSVAIYQDGAPVYAYVSGYSDFESNKRASLETKYRIGSVTKTFTALLTLLAVEDEKITLTQTLDRFYPEIPNAHAITIEQMLSHRSGIHSYTGDPNFLNYLKDGVTESELINVIASYPSDFEPGANEAYSNSKAYLLTLILERIYEQPYAKLIESKITKPLALANTYYAEELSAARGEAYSYHNESGMNRADIADHSVLRGAGGLVSTPTDLAKVFDAVFTGKLINEDSLRKMIAIKDTYGLGVEKFTFAGKLSYGHRGRVDEFNSIALYNPEERISLAVIDNSSFNEAPEIVKDILNAYFDGENPPISVEELEKFVGKYEALETDDNDIVEFERSESELILVINGEFREQLAYRGNNSFLFDQSYAPAIIFTFSEDGERLVLKQGDAEAEYKKKS